LKYRVRKCTQTIAVRAEATAASSAAPRTPWSPSGPVRSPTLKKPAARIAGAENVSTFDGNPDIVGDARDNFQRNGLQGIRSHVGILRNRQSISDPHEMMTFHINREFWASRLSASTADRDVVKTVQVPILCLEDVIKEHRATVLICDIEGAEVDLLSHADLAGIRLIIMETHYRAAGEVATDEMVRQLIMSGFSIHLGVSHNHFLVLRRRPLG